MNSLFSTLAHHAAQCPDAPALQGANSVLGYAQLNALLPRLSEALRAQGITRLGLLADNGVAWALVDLAALHAEILLVPLPPFFSASQLQHALHDSGVEAVFTDQIDRLQALLDGRCRPVEMPDFIGLQLLLLDAPSVQLPPSKTAKITYTSGTTGQPKGVCLSWAAMEQVAHALCAASEARSDDRHLCVLPLATLLENIGGLYVPLLAGACSTLLPLQQVGLQGASALDVPTLLNAMHGTRASSVIMVPQMLHALVAAVSMGAPKPAHLRFIAVGGAPVSPQLLERAQQLGLPVFEGYGLSECASVVALNSPSAHKLGSVGKPLPHVQVKFAADGEIWLAGAVFEGYLNLLEKPDNQGFWASGDVGYLDDEGFLFLTGRKKNMFITSFGRNVAPEWVERELTIQPVIAQAAVFGEARPWNTAIIVPRALPNLTSPEAVAAAIEAAIASANIRLPDYAQIKKWRLADAPFSPQNGFQTANGRLRRAEIWARYKAEIEDLYLREKISETPPGLPLSGEEKNGSLP